MVITRLQSKYVFTLEDLKKKRPGFLDATNPWETSHDHKSLYPSKTTFSTRVQVF
jgi:hypothetical protein